MIVRPRVLLLIPHFGGGGAEAVFALLARGLSCDKYEMHIGLVTQTNLPAGCSLQGVAVHVLGAGRIRCAAFRVAALVRRVRPHLILSGMFHLNFLVLLLRPFFPRPVRILVRQNGTVSSALENQPAYTRILYRILYRRADKVVCQSRAMADDLARELGLEESRLAVLPNPIDVDAIRLAARQSTYSWSGSGPHLVAVGRLSKEKGFDLLLESLQAVREFFPGVDLVIAGAGSEEVALKSRCSELGLDAAVRFAGNVDQPAVLFQGASAFVLSSRHEGMPNALLEAAAAGLPIVATAASRGIVDLLRDRPGTWLAAEITSAALADSIRHALECSRPQERFTHSFIEPFRLERAIRGYEELIHTALDDEEMLRAKR
ncbi:MAG: glycosyltransferase [Terracidiphilus sp.]|jgi:glycosyltransferase involved in cell wall biosynthesis